MKGKKIGRQERREEKDTNGCIFFSFLNQEKCKYTFQMNRSQNSTYCKIISDALHIISQTL